MRTCLRPAGRIAWGMFMFGLLFAGGGRAQAEPAVDLFVPLDPPRGRYAIDCSVRFEAETAVVAGEEAVVLVNDTGLPLTRLAFEWHADERRVIGMEANGRPVTIPAEFVAADAGTPLMIALPESVASGRTLRLDIRFESRFETEEGEVKHLWTAWHPRVDWGVPSQDDFDLRIDYPTEYTFACSARRGRDGAWRAEGVRRFGLFFLKGGEVYEKRAGDVLVRVVHTEAGAECARLVRDTAADAVDFYVRRFGFFPSDHIDIVPGADAPMGGYPPATGLVVIHGMERMAERNELHWRWITAHELGHQYWFERVMPESRGQIGWLMIGLGIYVDREYMRARGHAPDKHAGLIARYVDGVQAGHDTRADVCDAYLGDLDFDFNNVVVHGKGYGIISALDCLLGADLFDRIHAECQRRFAGRRLTFPDFQTVCEQESGQDLDWFFDQWVRSSLILSYRIASRECVASGGGYRTEIRVERAGTLDMPVPVTAYFEDGTEQTAFTARLSAESVVLFDSEAPLKDAVIDADGELPMVSPLPDPEELELRQLLASLPGRAVIDSLPRLVERVLATDISQTSFWGRLGRKLYDWGRYEDALAVFDRRARLLEEAESEWAMSAHGWRGLLLDLLGRREEALGAYNRALAVETDGEFSYNGDSVTINRAWLEVRLATPFTRE